MAIVFKDLPDEELVYGQKSCQGCGALLAGRLTMKVLGKKTVLATPACCFAATTSVYPESAIFVNNVVTAFPALASTLSGMAVAGEAMGWDEDITYLGIGGDGGTVDIGLQALSGAAERNENILYICYDNEAYMNTGVQRSGATPYGASTTTRLPASVQRAATMLLRSPSLRSWRLIVSPMWPPPAPPTPRTSWKRLLRPRL